MSNAQPGDGRILARGLYLEGLAVDHATGVVWYSDVIAGGVHGVTLGGDSVGTLNPDRMWTGGIVINADGCVLSSGAGGIMWNCPTSGQSGWLIDHIAGQPVNGINEMASDGAGGLYCGTVDIENIAKGEPARPASIYHIRVDGSASVVADGLGFVNAMVLSTDGKTLYYNDTFDATYAFAVLPDGALGPRRRLFDKPDCDGMALDAAGRVWVTGYRSSFIERLNADGTADARFATPAGGITQVRFCGAEMQDYVLTSVPADCGDRLAVGEVPSEPESLLLLGRADGPGLDAARPRFALR